MGGEISGQMVHQNDVIKDRPNEEGGTPTEATPTPAAELVSVGIQWRMPFIRTYLGRLAT
jgi:hypothetical protein